MRKHWKISVLALRRKFLFLDLGKSGWGILLFTIIGVTLGWCYSASHGLSIVNDNAAVMKNISKVVVFLAVFVAAPITLIGSLVIDSLPRSEAEMLAAYNDTSLSPFVRIFAASQMRDYAVAKGADGWAVIWEQRRQEI